MKKILTYLLIMACSISCKKHEKVAPGSTIDIEKSGEQPISTGSLSGLVTPSEAVTAVTITASEANKKSYVIMVEPVTGAFSLANIAEGTYILSFSNDARYNRIAPVNATIANDKNTSIGTITATENKPSYSISCNVNGEFKGWNLSSSYDTAHFTIALFRVSTYPEDTRTASFPAIILKHVPGPGTYICKGTSDNKITYSAYRLGSGYRASFQSTEYPGGEGTVIITSIDTERRTIKGTFTAKLISDKRAPKDTAIITNGLIDARY